MRRTGADRETQEKREWYCFFPSYGSDYPPKDEWGYVYIYKLFVLFSTLSLYCPIFLQSCRIEESYYRQITDSLGTDFETTVGEQCSYSEHESDVPVTSHVNTQGGVSFLRFRTISALEDHLLELTSPERRSFVSIVSGSGKKSLASNPSTASGEHKETEEKHKKIDASYTIHEQKSAHHTNRSTVRTQIAGIVRRAPTLSIVQKNVLRYADNHPSTV